MNTMTLHLLKTSLLLLSLLSISFSGWAVTESSNVSTEENTDEVLDDIRWYQVEVLIFKQQQKLDQVDEKWPHNIALSYPYNWVNLSDKPSASEEPILAEDSDAEETSDREPFPEFVMLPKQQRVLEEAAQRFKRNKMAVLFHEAWQQKFIKNNNENAPSILIRGGTQFDQHYELEGSISIELSRYLHFHTNLWFTHFAYNVGQNTDWPTLPSSPDQEISFDRGDSLDQLSLNNSFNNEFRIDNQAENNPLLDSTYIVEQISLMKQSRRMRSTETHYLDHPEIGIMLIFTPLEIPETADTEKETDTPLQSINP